MSSHLPFNAYNGHCETTVYLPSAFSKDSLTHLPTLKRGLELPRESKKNKEMDKTLTKNNNGHCNGHVANRVTFRNG